MTEPPNVDVALSGRPIAGNDPKEVQKALALLLKIPQDKAANLLLGRLTRVSRGVPQAKAQEQMQALHQAGAEATIVVHEALPRSDDPQTPVPSAYGTPLTPSDAEGIPPREQSPRADAARQQAGSPVVASAARRQPKNRAPVLPILLFSGVLAVAGFVAFQALAPDNPPRHLLLEPANEMLSDLIRVHRVLEQSTTYSSAAHTSDNHQRTPSLENRPLEATVGESLRQSQGEASLTPQMQQDVDRSRISDSLLESRGRIRTNLEEIEDGIDGFSDEYAAAYNQLRALFANYDQLLDLALNPARRHSLIEYARAYETGRSAFNRSYLGVLSTFHGLEEGDPADEEFFEAEVRKAMELTEDFKEQLGE